jgi:hypothetical protein
LLKILSVSFLENQDSEKERESKKARKWILSNPFRIRMNYFLLSLFIDMGACHKKIVYLMSE